MKYTAKQKIQSIGAAMTGGNGDPALASYAFAAGLVAATNEPNVAAAWVAELKAGGTKVLIKDNLLSGTDEVARQAKQTA